MGASSSPRASVVVEDLHVFYPDQDGLRYVEKISRVYVKWPRAICAVIWGLILVMSLVAVTAGWADIADTTTFDWTVADSVNSENDDALADAREKLADQEDGSAPVRSEKAFLANVQFIYEWADGRDSTILTGDNMHEICKFQRLMIGLENYPKFCLPSGGAAGINTDCSAEDFDLTALVYPTFADRLACQKYTDEEMFGALATNLGLTNLTGAALADPALLEPLLIKLVFFLERDIDLNELADLAGAIGILGELQRTRSQLSMYGPLGDDSTPDGEAFSSVLDDDTGPQADIYRKFLVDEAETAFFEAFNLEPVEPFGSGYNVGAFKLGDGGLQVRMHSFYWRDQEFTRLVQWDQLMAGGAVAFVGIAVGLHLRSLFLTVTGLFAIIFSIPVALFIYTGILGINYFNQVHIVVVFLILGIGADDLLLWVDAFYQSERFWHTIRGHRSVEEAKKVNTYGLGNGEDEVLVARLTYTYLRAAGAVFNTSFTTMAAFLATGVSPVTPVAGFGFFAAVTILVNFLWTVLLYPCAVVIWHRHFVGRPFCGACLRPRTRDLLAEDADAPVVVSDDSSTEASIETGQVSGLSTKAQRANTVRIARPAHVETWEEKIFSKGYVPLMERNVKVNLLGKERTVRYVAIAFAAALGVMLVVMASFALQLDTPKDADEPFSDSHMFTGFIDDYSRLFKGGSDFMEVEVTFGIEGIDRDGFKRFEPNGYRGAVIFDDDFDLAPQTAQQFVLDTCAGYAALSCIPSGATEQLGGCVDDSGLAVRSVSCKLDQFHAWHATTYPSETAAIALGDEDAALWLSRLQEWAAATGNDRNVGVIEGSLRFFTFTYEASVKGFQPVNIKQPVLELLDEHLDSVRAAAPNGLDTVFQTSFDFTWINSELGIVEGMFAGLAISIPVAYVVLLIATSNVLLATIAIVGIVAIVGSVLGTAYLLGWALGVAEAIAAIMVVGLSVDYSVVHGTSYTHASREGLWSRHERFDFSARMVGPTVLAVAFTTAGSAAVLLLAELSFFTQMGTLIAMTIGYSVLFTDFFVLPLFLLIGPQGDRGDWRAWIDARRGKEPSGNTKSAKVEA